MDDIFSMLSNGRAREPQVLAKLSKCSKFYYFAIGRGLNLPQ